VDSDLNMYSNNGGLEARDDRLANWECRDWLPLHLVRDDHCGHIGLDGECVRIFGWKVFIAAFLKRDSKITSTMEW
jgi:hypothetical protein